MGTKSNIGFLNKDGTIKSIYCHCDGYPEYNGIMLQKFYNSKNKVNQLIELGNISSLKEKLNPSTPNHSFDFPEDNVSIAYSRDRGDINTQAHIDITTENYRERLMDNLYDYNYAYLFDEKSNKWLFLDLIDLKYGDKLEKENFLDNFISLESILEQTKSNEATSNDLETFFEDYCTDIVNPINEDVTNHLEEF